MPVADGAIAVCEKHLTDTASFNTEIESFLVKYLLTLICAEYEEAIEQLVHARASKSNDPHLISFIKSATEKLFRSLRITEINGLLGRFSTDVKDQFAAQITNTAAHTSFDTIVTNRLQIAHTTGVVQLTFPELKVRYEESKDIIRQIAAVLNVPSPL